MARKSTASPRDRVLRIVLGNQLFPIERLPPPEDTCVFMAEDMSLCTDVAHHKHKLVLFLAAMRNYADRLAAAGYHVRYHKLDDDDGRPYEQKLSAAAADLRSRRASYFEIEDRPMAARIAQWARHGAIATTEEPSPMFLCSRAGFADYLAGTAQPRMADFYRRERNRLGILVNADGSPTGGRWSFDTENRRRLPRELDPPPLPLPQRERHVADVAALVEDRFPAHPGATVDFWLPVTRAGAIAWLGQFVDERLAGFGTYEDAISTRSRHLFHSVLSPLLNLGLLTPDEVVDRVIAAAQERPIAPNDLEGFVRQVIGWREFVRGIYHAFGREQAAANFWGHDRLPGPAWRTGDTGIEPLDDAIRNASRWGWDHHIVRLMVVGNLMVLAGIEPRAAHRWFMEMYVDSSDWVMGPNVYGMALFSDGGIFATKPYLCGSNYLLKMSDYRRGPWCDIVDGLYWRFVAKHRAFFAGNPRLSMMPGLLARISPARLSRITALAETFIDTHTRAGAAR